MLRRAAAATQELLQRREVVACVLFRVPARENVAPMRRRRREGRSALTTVRRATVSALASTATRAHGRASAATAARGTGETGRARSHGGFVDSRAVRRRKRVSWRPPQARASRGSRGGKTTRVRAGNLVFRQLRARAGDVFKVSSLERLNASPAVCSRSEFEGAGPHVRLKRCPCPLLPSLAS